MAAAVVESTKLYDLGPFFLSEVVLKTCTADQTENVAHGGPKGQAPIAVYTTVHTEADSHEVCSAARLPASDSLTNGTIAVVTSVENAGAITGAKFAVYALFAARADQTGATLYTSFTA